ncbi:uncharacterized protein LOC128379245 [Scomber scombrus]|uniref:Uncharacterized protein LOC128379245 n=1 Tax=Scomber scombrus TaxID=13677 RepID=A0AAV1Q866_SCOSC
MVNICAFSLLLDIDECQKPSDICGPYSSCNNTVGSYNCTCLIGFNATNPALPTKNSNPCNDIDECLANVCGDNGTCDNKPGSYSCECHKGYQIVPDATPVCQDIDECFNSTICGPGSVCTNTPGAHTCACEVGYTPTQPDQEPSENNICLDIDECVKDPPICGPSSNCTNSIGSYNCTCFIGYRLNNPDVIASLANPCTDIDECIEKPGLCGKQTVCTNEQGTFYCSCPDGFFPSTGILWKMGVSFCQSLQDILDAIVPPEEVSGVGPVARSIRVSSEGDGETGSVILGISDRLVAAMVSPTQNQTRKAVQTSTVDLSLRIMGPASHDDISVLLSAKGQTMNINLQSLAEKNNGSAAVAFMTLTGMESLLSHQYFKTENKTEMYSDVFTAILPSVNHTNLTEPVNFTIQHKKKVPESGIVTCVYWEDKHENNDEAGKEGETMRWSVEGCWVAYSDENNTVCSCSHLSTFALIMQIGEVYDIPLYSV